MLRAPHQFRAECRAADSRYALVRVTLGKRGEGALQLALGSSRARAGFRVTVKMTNQPGDDRDVGGGAEDRRCFDLCASADSFRGGNDYLVLPARGRGRT